MTTPRALTGTSSSEIKSHNRRAILLTLLRQELVSRVGLAQVTGLSTTTITNLVTELLEQHVVIEDTTEQSGKRSVGRPQTALRLVPDSRYAVSVHFNVDSLLVAVTNLLAQPVVALSRSLLPDMSADEVLMLMAELIENVIAESNIDPAQIVGLGVGVSGLVNSETGVNLISPSVDWHNVPVRNWLSNRFAFPVQVENAVRAMALGEKMFGSGKEVHSLAFVYSHVGVGAGFVIGGEIYRGSCEGAGEIGHTIIIPDGGISCRCGKSGCLESLVSVPSVVKYAHEIAHQHKDSLLAKHFMETSTASDMNRIFEAAREGDSFALEMLRERARYMGIALANLINVLNPELIVMGGLFAQGADVLLPQVESTMRNYAFAHLGEHVQLKPTQFGEHAGIVGAAALALDAFFYRSAVEAPAQGNIQ